MRYAAAMRGFFIFFLLLVPGTTALSQSSQPIEILGANALKLDTLNKARKLVGNVKLRQGEVTMTCDSALFYTQANAVDAFGNVFIYDKETKVYADTMKYDGRNKDATLYGNVRVIQDSATLVTNRLAYNSETKYATYRQGGKITAGGMTATSVIGHYYASLKTAHFRREVIVTDKDYRLTSDTLIYDTEKKISYFMGPTVITRPDEVIYCESGWHNASTDNSAFGRNTLLHSGTQKIYADSLFFNNASGTGDAFKFFRWTDTTMNAALSGRRGVFLKSQNRVTATDSALLVYIINRDTLFLTADTLLSRKDSASNTEFFAYRNTRIFKSDLQGACDSLAFTFQDSLIMMYREPVLWNEENQLTGDTIAIFLKDKKIHRFELFENGFIASRAHDELFNQVKGRRITGYFREGALDRMFAEGNGESIYYGKDEQNAFIGVNKAVCSNMWIYIKEKQVNRIVFLTEPEAAFSPLSSVNVKELLLKNFSWREAEKPKSKEDLFR